MDIASIITDVGFPIALVSVLLWERKKVEDRNHGRQELLTTRLGKVEDFVRNELITILNRAVTVIEKHEKHDIEQKNKQRRDSDDC